VYHGYKKTHTFENAIVLSEYGIDAGNKFFEAKKYMNARDFYTRGLNHLTIAENVCNTMNKVEEQSEEEREEDEYYCNEVKMLLADIYFRIGQTFVAENNYKDAVEEFNRAYTYVEHEDIKSNIEKYSSMIGGRRRKTVKKVKKTKKSLKKNKKR
jgi:tetratricopeptide (TPR) repeat protein